MRARVRRLLALAALGLVASASRAARADCAPARVSTCVDADQLWPHAGAGPFFAIGPTTTTPTSLFAVGLVGSILSRPIGLRVASADPAGTKVYVVDDAVDATLSLAWGVTDRFELDLAAPVTLFQSGAGLAGVDGGGPSLPRSALRDLRFGFAYGLIPPPRTGLPRGFGLVGRVDFVAPTATKDAWAGGRTAALAPTLAGSWRRGRLLAGLEVGARIRGDEPVGSVITGSQLFFALGASLEVLSGGRLGLSAEAFALPTLARQGAPTADALLHDAQPLIPAEWIASLTSAPFMAGDLSIALGAGGPIPFSKQAALGDPRFRFDFALRYAPTGRDTDGDGIPDARDKCPNEPEDKDGFQDEDGCPDPDNDKDGIPDSRDKCPNEPEDFDGFEDQDGCPDKDSPRRTKRNTEAGESPSPRQER